MSILSGISNLLALLYAFRSVQLSVQIGRNWANIKQEPLTRAKQQLAEQAAFFISVPPAVLVHEFCHALAVWLFGGQVVTFAYRIFWGYVVPAGDFTPAQQWFIAIAGTLGSLLFGVGIWLALRHNASRSLRYFGLRSFRFQIYFSLLYYPLITVVLPIGDWRMIYDFAATPVLSAATAVAHVGLLLAFWQADRHGRFEMPAFDSAAQQQRYEQLRQVAATGDTQAQLQAIDILRRGGAGHQAQRQLESFLAANPNSADGLLMLALMRSKNGVHLDGKSVELTQQALAAGLPPERAAFAHEALGRTYLEQGNWTAAEAELNQALALNPMLNRQADLLYWRSQAQRRLGRLDAAAADICAAIDLALRLNDAVALARYQQELDVIRNHGGSLPPGCAADGVVSGGEDRDMIDD